MCYCISSYEFLELLMLFDITDIITIITEQAVVNVGLSCTSCCICVTCVADNFFCLSFVPLAALQAPHLPSPQTKPPAIRRLVIKTSHEKSPIHSIDSDSLFIHTNFPTILPD